MTAGPLQEYDAEAIYTRFLELRDYVGWEKEDARRVRKAGRLVKPHLRQLVEDFYHELQQHPDTSRVITGGRQQITRLKKTLKCWLEELFRSEVDRDYVARRWHVGRRHVEIGLRQIYVNAALSRLRGGILAALQREWTGEPQELFAVERAVNRALDLDLAIIQDAYESERHSRSEAAFRNLVEAAGCVIVIVRDNHGIAYFNPFAERLIGYAAEEVVGHDFLSTLFPASQRSDVSEQIHQAIAGSPAVRFDGPVVCSDGSQRLLVWNARRLKDFDGAPAVLTVGHDITELKQAQQRALQAERLAAIGQTVAGLAHESRNAFQRIQACLEMLSLEVEDRPDALDLVNRIQRAQDHLHQLYEEVRSYAAPITLDRQMCDLSQVWRDAWEHLEVSRRAKQVRLHEEIDGVDAYCAVDVFAMGQVFRNVFENALAVCPGGGVIETVASENKVEGKSFVTVSVRDHGPGMPPDVLRRVFDPFFTTKTKGTGLGMAIAKRVVEAHGGSIAVANRPEGGAQVLISLPRQKP